MSSETIKEAIKEFVANPENQNNSDVKLWITFKFLPFLESLSPTSAGESQEDDEQQDLRGEVMGICIKADYYHSMNHIEDFRKEMEKLRSFTITRKIN